MNTSRYESMSFKPAGWERLPIRYESLPGQMELFSDEDEAACSPVSFGDLFDTGRDLPGARERGQKIIWDLDE